MAKDPSSYEIGYKKPPKDTQFKKGESGNSKGRPKGRTNASLKDEIFKQLDEKITITENGRKKTLTRLQLAIRRLGADAISGKAASTKLLFNLIEKYGGAKIEQIRFRPEDLPDVATAFEYYQREVAGAWDD